MHGSLHFSSCNSPVSVEFATSVPRKWRNCLVWCWFVVHFLGFWKVHRYCGWTKDLWNDYPLNTNLIVSTTVSFRGGEMDFATIHRLDWCIHPGST